MKLGQKIALLSFAILILGVVTSSFILVKASVEDKQNFIFDNQTSSGLVLGNLVNSQLKIQPDLNIKGFLLEK